MVGYKTKPYKRQANKELALKLGIQTSNDEICIPSLSSILLVVHPLKHFKFGCFY